MKAPDNPSQDWIDGFNYAAAHRPGENGHLTPDYLGWVTEQRGFDVPATGERAQSRWRAHAQDMEVRVVITADDHRDSARLLGVFADAYIDWIGHPGTAS